jgi:PhnB protein
VLRPAEADRVVFGHVTNDHGFRIMAYDLPAWRTWSPGEDPFFVSVRGADPAEITT